MLLRDSPYFFLGRRPFREARLRSYILRQHRLGRPVSEIVDDPYLARHGNRTLCWSVLCEPETIAVLEADVRDAMQASRPS